MNDRRTQLRLSPSPMYSWEESRLAGGVRVCRRPSPQPSPGVPGEGVRALRLIFALAILLLTCAFAPAQSTQPVSKYDDQPVKRTRPEAETPEQKQVSTGFDWGRLVVAMGVVLGLIVVLKFVVGRMYPSLGANKGAKVVRVLSRSPITPRQNVMLLQVGRRVIVVGDSGGQLATLSEISDPDEVASLIGQLENVETSIPASRFSSLFGKAREDYVEPEPESTPRPEPEIEEAQTEISGLIERMRTLTKAVRRE